MTGSDNEIDRGEAWEGMSRGGLQCLNEQPGLTRSLGRGAGANAGCVDPFGAGWVEKGDKSQARKPRRRLGWCPGLRGTRAIG